MGRCSVEVSDAAVFSRAGGHFISRRDDCPVSLALSNNTRIRLVARWPLVRVTDLVLEANAVVVFEMRAEGDGPARTYVGLLCFCRYKQPRC